MIIDLSLSNAALYEGCAIKEVGGRLTLTTPVEEAGNIIGRNAAKMVVSATDRAEVVLTGPMAVWAYLVIFHIVVHKFNCVYYDDGRSGKVLIAQH
ncbi:MAG: hypothetical protein EHM49_04320 [Deltaproteobacteria bacterium]|nr:MAG: hypothetical protein EHM49_04320 [Deltaproteobacteria bacterium]